MIVIGCSHGKHLAPKIAKKARIPYSDISVDKFPDHELHITFGRTDFKGRKVFLVQSFYGEIDSCLIEVMLAAKSAKEMGASSVSLMAPYFPYFRQDTWFSDQSFDKIIIMDPHLHREKTLSHIFKIHCHKITANPMIAERIKKTRKPLIVGPDYESYRWAKETADIIGAESTILEKTRHSSRRVDVRFRDHVQIGGKTIILIDDIISTGNTLIKTIKKLKALGIKEIACYAVHGIFAENALVKLKRTGVKVITTNSIPNPVAQIDISGLFAEMIQKAH